MSNFLNFVGRVVVVFVLLMISISCLLGYQWFSPRRVAVVEEEVAPAIVLPSDKEPAVCRYREGMGADPDEGILLQEDTFLKGPAIVKKDSMTIAVVMPQVTYEAPSGAVVWLYEGNYKCLLAQAQFFEGKEIQFFSPDM